MKKLTYILCMFMPARLKRVLYIKLFGWDIHPTASIGFSLLMPKHLKMGENAKIGSLTLVKGLQNLQIDNKASLGRLNWVTGFPLGHASAHFKDDIERDPSLYIAEHSAITARHIIDCTSKITIGRFTTFAGFRSQILTHSIDLKANKQSSKPIQIGDYCFVGTACILLPGSKIHDHSIISAGAVIIGDLKMGEHLFGGVPAKAIQEVDSDTYIYLKRETGYVI